MRTPVLTCLGLSAAALMAASCAPTATTGDRAEAPLARQCFYVQQVSNFRQGRMDQVYLRVGRSDVYEMTGAACRDLDFANRLAILPDMGGAVGSRLCTGDWARVVVPGSANPNEVCRVRLTRRLSDAEVEALPSAYKP